jgi:ribonuclease P protein component
VHVVERPDPASRSRVGIAVDGSAGGAVARNRIKRRVRAAFLACEVGPGRDVVVRVGGQVGRVEFQKLVGNVREALTRTGAL